MASLDREPSLIVYIQADVGAFRPASRTHGLTFRRRSRPLRSSWRSPVTAAAGPALKAASAGLVAAISSSPSPLWLLGVQCAGSAAAALCGAIVLSQKLHQAADRADDGEVRTECATKAADPAGLSQAHRAPQKRIARDTSRSRLLSGKVMPTHQ